jgi:hypothetical protein
MVPDANARGWGSRFHNSPACWNHADLLLYFFFGFWLLLVAMMESTSRRWYIGIWQMVRSYW